MKPHRLFCFVSLLLSLLVYDLMPSCCWAKKLNFREKYEQTMIQWALKHTKLQPELEPEGKIIERVVIVRANVIAPFDPWPNLINYIHVKTRDSIIRRELLIQPGETWKQALVDESERNLRALHILSTARTVACKSKRPKHVILLVITKDIWSLRLSTSFNFSGTVLHELGFYPMEMNLAGFGKQLGLFLTLLRLDLADFLVRDQATLGQFYFDPRLFGTRLQLYEELSLFLNGEVPCGGAMGNKLNVWCPKGKPGEPNGFFGRITLARTLFSLATQWAFSFNIQALMRQRRFYRLNDPGGDIPPGERGGLSLQTVQFPHDSGEIRAVPRVYNTTQFVSSAGVTYSMGWQIKHDFGASLGVTWYSYAPPENFPFEDNIRAKFIQYSLPRSESNAYLNLSYTLRSARFVRRSNVHLFGLSEDFTIGPSIILVARPAIDLLNPTQQYVSLAASASYLWDIAGNMFYLSVSAGTRWQPRSNEIGIPGPWLNSNFQAAIYNISPVLGIGRLFARAEINLRDNNIDNSVSSLGNDSGLRGYSEGLFAGENKIQFNVEFRTLPLNLWTLHIGMVAFYDGGALWGGRNPNRPTEALPLIYRHTVGFGFRALFPQFSKSVVRVDMGIPLQDDRGPFLSWISVTFGQAF